jgi:UDP-2-acetamido-2-deoxy-ribo-hexuluronate aminotransferase
MQFIDLKQQYRRYQEEIRAEMDRVLDTSQYIMGPVLADLEKELAEYTGVPFAIGCGSGTDAILLALMALGVKAGDEVIVPDFTFFATAETVSFLGARPVFVDIRPDTYNIDPQRIEEVITPRTRGIIAVSLYGQCADFDALNQIAVERGLFLIEDAAQSFGAVYRGRKSGSLCELATTSFYPAKPLGAYGDGGAVFTSNQSCAEKIRALLNHGQVATYRHRYVGLNGRMDALQAAVLRVKLRHFNEELRARQQVAKWYSRELQGELETPMVLEGNMSSWAQYTVRSPSRDRITGHLKSKGIPTAIHYPLPLHEQEVYAGIQLNGQTLQVSTRMSREVFSLPMHPFLSREEVGEVSAAVREARASRDTLVAVEEAR